MLLLFCVLFPLAKLIALLVATSALIPLSLNTRERTCRLAAVTGKYSLLDILVVAILIVLIKFQHVAEVEPRAGTWLFCVGILLSMGAGTCTDFSHLKTEQEVSSA